MQILICDDEKVFQENIADYCRRFMKEYEIPIRISMCQSGDEALALCRKEKNIDICILDIKMDGMNGMRLAKEIRNLGMRSRIVFLTSYVQYAPKGYEVGASRYWMKPISYEKFCSEIQSLYEEIQRENNNYFYENLNDVMERVYFDEIAFIETKGRKTCVHKRTGCYDSTMKMREYEAKLDDRFFRCHAAYIVNMDYIVRLHGLEITLSTGDTIYASKARRSSFVKRLRSYLIPGAGNSRTDMNFSQL